MVTTDIEAPTFKKENLMSETTVLDVPLDAVATSATPAPKKGAKRGAKPKLVFPGSVTFVEGKEVLTMYSPTEVDGKKVFIPEGYDPTKHVPFVRGNYNSKFDWPNFRAAIFDVRAAAARAHRQPLLLRAPAGAVLFLRHD